MVIEVHISSHYCICFTFDHLTCSHSSAMPQEMPPPRRSPEVCPCLCSLLPRAENLLSSGSGCWSGLFPLQPGHSRDVVKCRQPTPTWDARIFFLAKAAHGHSFALVVVFCIFWKTCLCPHMLISALKWSVELRKLYSRAYSPLHPGVEVRLCFCWQRFRPWQQDFFPKSGKFTWNVAAVRSPAVFSVQKYLDSS